MVSMQDFNNASRSEPGDVSICERDGRLCSMPINEVDISKYCNVNLNDYPDINIRQETQQPTNVTRFSDCRDSYGTVMMPVNESAIKRLTRIYFEHNLYVALCDASEYPFKHRYIGKLAKGLLYVIDAGKNVQMFFKPHLRNSVKAFGTNISSQRPSIIKGIKWHPNCFKIAVACNDNDSIRVYTEDKNNVQILKSYLQKYISSMAWRPLTPGELAVGGSNGILLWTLDSKPLTNVTPLSQAIQLKHENHLPVTSLEWTHNGNLLISASIKDSDLLIWDVDQNRNTPLKRVGPPCTFLRLSPDGYRLLSSTYGKVFRVWTTDRWIPERWTVPFGKMQTAAWSPCGNYLLFTTTDETILYCLQFIEEQLYANVSIPKQAVAIANLAKISIGDTKIGGQPKTIAWDSTGKHLAIIFKDADSDAIAIFRTTINRHIMTIAPDCFIVGKDFELPKHICFQPFYKRKPMPPILTIGWSSGRVQYFPFN